MKKDKVTGIAGTYAAVSFDPVCYSDDDSCVMRIHLDHTSSASRRENIYVEVKPQGPQDGSPWQPKVPAKGRG